MSLVAVIMLAGVRASDAAVRIGQDRGGRMGVYVDKYQGLRSSGEMVIMDGDCLSACTIVLGSVPHDRICVTSRAKLGFHAAWNPASNGRKKTNPEATHTLYSLYPLEVQRWIDRRPPHDFPERPRSRGHVSPMRSGFTGFFALKRRLRRLNEWHS